MQFIKVGIAGTAKNTGKTTATIAIMAELRARGIPLLLTSIGYDGESIDAITGLPKPRLEVKAGDIVATAEMCLKTGTAAFRVLETTDVGTPLGKVQIAEVLRPGLVVTAGPNKTHEVRRIADMLKRLSHGVAIFDGALNRIAPFGEMDGMILATGAAKSRNIALLAAQAQSFAAIARLPQPPAAAEIARRNYPGVTVLDAGLRVRGRSMKLSLLTAQDVDSALAADIPEGGCLYVPGIITGKALAALAERLEGRRVILAVQDPVKLLVAAEDQSYFAMLTKLDEAGVLVAVLKRVPLMAITVNPFYPEYRVEDNTYVPGMVDPVRLQLTVKSAVNLPVVNVSKGGAKMLAEIILSHAGRWESPATMEF
ncbi:MAG: hypothetical protein N2491_01500 [Negativicutes bacterium]|nr:hypothetical protein [Negativicutes bacterium]